MCELLRAKRSVLDLRVAYEFSVHNKWTQLIRHIETNHHPLHSLSAHRTVTVPLGHVPGFTHLLCIVRYASRVCRRHG
jgi:hypothetical protein